MNSMRFTNYFKGKAKASLIVALFIALGSSFSANAQEMADLEEDGMPDRAGEFNFGVRAGVTFGYFGQNFERADAGLQSFGTKKGFVGTVYGTYHWNNWFATRLEASFLQTGHANIDKTNVDILNTPSVVPVEGYTVASRTSTITLNHIDIPVLFVLDPPNVFERWSPHFYAGPAFGINLNAYEENIRTYESPNPFGGPSLFTTTGSNDVTSQFTNLDMAAVMGVGVNYPIKDKSWTLVFDLRYRMGLSNVNQGVTVRNGLPAEFTTNTIALSAGIEF